MKKSICFRSLFTATLIVSMLAVRFSAHSQDIHLPRSLRTGVNNGAPQSHINRPTFFAGGNVNSNFGSYLALTLEGGIYVKDWLRFGAGPRYEVSLKSVNMLQHAFGATVYGEGIIANHLMLHLGYEFLNYPTIETDENGIPIVDPYGDYTEVRKNIHALSLGVGFFSYLSDKISLYALYSINPLQTKNDYYSLLPMFARVGIAFEF